MPQQSEALVGIRVTKYELAMQKLKLCFVAYGYAIPRNGGWLLNDKFGTLLEKLAISFAEITFLISRPPTTMLQNIESQASYTYTVRAANVKIIGVPPSDIYTNPLAKLLAMCKRTAPYYAHIRTADFVYITMPGFSSYLAHLICRLLNKPYGLYFGSDWQEIAPYMATWRGLTGRLLQPYQRFSLAAEHSAVKHAQFALVHGNQLADKFKTAATPVVQTIPLSLITPKDFYRREDTCQGSIPRLLFVGALTPRKGLDYLLKACHQLAKCGQQFELIIAGSGDSAYVAYLKEQILLLSLEHAVTFVGYVAEVSELLRLYRQADLFILPSQGEGFPRVIYEAMSQSLPVIASDIGTIRSMLQHGYNVLLVPPKDPDTLATVIAMTLNDSKLRRHMIANGYQFALDHLGQGESANQIADLIMLHYNGTKP